MPSQREHKKHNSSQSKPDITIGGSQEMKRGINKWERILNVPDLGGEGMKN